MRGRGNLTLVGLQRIQGKCGYLCLTPNALLRIAVCSAQAVPTGVKRRGPDSTDIRSGALRIAMPHFG